jgi:hypothetical protein
MLIAAPSYALNLYEKIIYVEARLGSEKVLINRFTGKVEKKLVGKEYRQISTQKGWGGIPSEQEMYQAQYDMSSGR